MSAATSKPKFTARGCLRRTVLFIKILLILALLVGAGIIGGVITNAIVQNSFQGERDKIAALERRTGELVSGIQDLEDQNNDLLTENQGLKEQLKTEEQKRLEEQKKQQINFTTKELGRRLMSFQLDKPALYFEYDRSFEQVKVDAFPAEFTKEIVAEGIEITFAKSPIVITIEPWKFSGRALQEVTKFTETTADGKSAEVVVAKDDKERYTITARIVSGDKQDAVKLQITANTDKESQERTTQQIRDILRSLELNIKEL